MKIRHAFFLLAGVWFASSCAIQRDVQVELSDAVLIRIDTLQHFNGTCNLQLNWKCGGDGVNYVSFLPAERNPFAVGTHMYILQHR
jgi:hypothetical protein